MRSAAGDFSVLRSAGFSAGLVVKRIKLLNAVFKEIVMRYVGYQQSQHKRGGGKHTGVFRDEKAIRLMNISSAKSIVTSRWTSLSCCIKPILTSISDRSSARSALLFSSAETTKAIYSLKYFFTQYRPVSNSMQRNIRIIYIQYNIYAKNFQRIYKKICNNLRILFILTNGFAVRKLRKHSSGH